MIAYSYVQMINGNQVIAYSYVQMISGDQMITNESLPIRHWSQGHEFDSLSSKNERVNRYSTKVLLLKISNLQFCYYSNTLVLSGSSRSWVSRGTLFNTVSQSLVYVRLQDSENNAKACFQSAMYRETA